MLQTQADPDRPEDMEVSCRCLSRRVLTEGSRGCRPTAVSLSRYGRVRSHGFALTWEAVSYKGDAGKNTEASHIVLSVLLKNSFSELSNSEIENP